MWFEGKVREFTFSPSFTLRWPLVISWLTFISIKRNILKKIYNDVTENIFDTSNGRIFREIEKKKWDIFITELGSITCKCNRLQLQLL